MNIKNLILLKSFKNIKNKMIVKLNRKKLVLSPLKKIVNKIKNINKIDKPINFLCFFFFYKKKGLTQLIEEIVSLKNLPFLIHLQKNC